KGLDLVEISPNANPPVCKIQDFGKFLYEQDKRERAAKKKQKVITIKEVKFSVNVDEHDYEFKKNNVLRFLAEGDKVKASLRFRGREMAHTNLGRGVIERLIKDVGENAIVEFRPRMEGNTLHAILAPKKVEGVSKPRPPQPPRPQTPPATAGMRTAEASGIAKEKYMPKLKTHSGGAKRFKKTASGRVKRGHAFSRHILTSKPTKRKRQLDTNTMVDKADQPKIKRMIPY